MTGIQGILFDLDQTLVDRDQSLRLFLSWQWKKHHSLQAISDDAFIKKFIELDDNGKVWKDKVYYELLRDFNILDIEPSFLVKEYFTDFSQHAVLYPMANEVLSVFKNKQIKLGIITNGREDLQSAVVRACGLEAFMNIILISETEKVRKPGPKIFESALSQLSLPPSSCIFIGDNPVSDIRGAYDAGMKTIWKKNDQFSAPNNAITSAVFSHFEELPKIVGSLGNTVPQSPLAT